MAQNLSFSIANILRSDFPPPSHIRHVPRCIYLERLNDSRNLPYVALRCQLDRRASFCNETEFFARNYYSAHTLSVISEKDAKIQNSGYAREQQRKKDILAANGNKKTEEDKRNSELPGSAAKSTVKKKRNRSHFTQGQLKYLEDVFTRQQYLTRDERAMLATVLNMTELQIRNWFQNRRYQLRHRGLNRAKQVPVKVLVSSSTGQDSDDRSM